MDAVKQAMQAVKPDSFMDVADGHISTIHGSGNSTMEDHNFAKALEEGNPPEDDDEDYEPDADGGENDEHAAGAAETLAAFMSDSADHGDDGGGFDSDHCIWRRRGCPRERTPAARRFVEFLETGRQSVRVKRERKKPPPGSRLGPKPLRCTACGGPLIAGRRGEGPRGPASLCLADNGRWRRQGQPAEGHPGSARFLVFDGDSGDGGGYATEEGAGGAAAGRPRRAVRRKTHGEMEEDWGEDDMGEDDETGQGEANWMEGRTAANVGWGGMMDVGGNVAGGNGFHVTEGHMVTGLNMNTVNPGGAGPLLAYDSTQLASAAAAVEVAAAPKPTGAWGWSW